MDCCRAGIEQQAKADRVNIGQISAAAKLPEIVSQKYEDEYPELAAVGRKVASKTAPNSVGEDDVDSSDEVEVLTDQFDEEGKPLRKAKIEPLPAIDHSQIVYPSFKKCFYKETTSLQQMSAEDYLAYHDSLEIQLTSPVSKPVSSLPRAIISFDQAGFESKLLREIQGQGFTKPTAIQSQALPLIMSGHDVLALARTGSGKTYAYLWPLIVHIMHQPQMQVGDGPIGLILAPTRELVIQISQKSKPFSKLYNIRSVAVYGGSGKYQMQRSLQEGTPEIVIATPGRLIDMIRSKATNLRRCTMLILDEADCMFDIGFEYQIRSIIQHIRPDKQCCMFSATMKKKIEQFARDVFRYQEIRIQIGNMKEGHEDIQQRVAMCSNDDEKYLWLVDHLDDIVAEGKVLIFTLAKASADVLAMKLRMYFEKRQLAIGIDTLHGDKDQQERNQVMQRFKRALNHAQETRILIATDIAARGLDVQDIRTVLNYEIPKTLETYIHRIGRTGRMGVNGITPGVAYTLLMPTESSFAVDLVHYLTLSKQQVSVELHQLASKDPKFHRFPKHGHGGSRGGFGGAASRGGLGSETNQSKAMTSQMMASQTRVPTSPSFNPSLYGGFVKSTEAPSSSSNADSEQQQQRKSRFDEVEVKPVLIKGFVRSSTSESIGTYSTTNSEILKPLIANVESQSHSQEQPQQPVRKKSRWDN